MLPRRTARAVRRVQAPTPTRIGPRYRTWLSDDAYRTASLSAITVCIANISADPDLNTDSLSGKKIKRRLEDLERRAGSSSASPEQQHAELATVNQIRPREDEAARKRRMKAQQQQHQQQQTSASGPMRNSSNHSTPSSSAREDASSMFSRQYTRQLSASPPPAFTYSSYPMPEPPPIHAPYPQHAPFHSLPAPYTDYQNQSLYLPPLPVTLPSMASYESPIKAETQFSEDDMISHFNMSYASMGGMEVPTTQSYADSNAYVNHPEYSFRFL